MTYLVDANVLSEPTRIDPNPQIVEWLSANERNFAVDPIILGEIRIGILLLPHGRKRTNLTEWFDELLRTIECIPWDHAVSARWSELVASLRRKGQTLPLLDSMIAATALSHDLIVATRNESDFRRAGVKVLNPFL
ncbi:MAG: hypothetical protein AMXMBFR82_42450 [Candidatus Hydrogenedentota bacterium]